MITGSEYLLGIAAYKPGASEEEIRRTYGFSQVEKLASNENPFGPSPKAIEAATQALSKVHRYNDGGLALRNAIAERYGTSIESVTVNNGSDALIHQIMRTFLLPGESALSCEGGFVSFGIAVKSVGRTPVFVKQAEGYRFDAEALVDAIEPHTKIVYIPNPNNPTGTHLTESELDLVISRTPKSTLIVLDEAYVEYASAIAPDTYKSGILHEAANVITLRTFSKAYGLAAFRIGYAVGKPDVVSWLLKTKLPFDPNGIGCVAAIAALDDHEHVAHTVNHTTSGIKVLTQALRSSGYACSDSVANFVFVDCGSEQQATEFHLALLEKGFITRPLVGFGIPTAVRISVGTPDQNLRLVTALQDLAPAFAND